MPVTLALIGPFQMAQVCSNDGSLIIMLFWKVAFAVLLSIVLLIS